MVCHVAKVSEAVYSVTSYAGLLEMIKVKQKERI
jgi:hypothetical protein